MRTCTRLTRKGQPCRRWALRGEPWCPLHHPLNVEPGLECVGGPWDGDLAETTGVGEAIAWHWHLIGTTTPEFFRASMAELQELAGLHVVGTYYLERYGDEFMYVWERTIEHSAAPAHEVDSTGGTP